MQTNILSRARAPFAYAVAGSAWVVVTSLAIPWVEGVPLASALPEVLKGLVFIALSTLFLRVVYGRPSAPPPAGGTRLPSSLAREVAALAAVTAGAVILGYLLGQDSRARALREARVPLQNDWLPHGLAYGLLLGAFVAIVGACVLGLWRAHVSTLGTAALLAEDAKRHAEEDRDRWERLVLDLPGVGVGLADTRTDEIVYANEELAKLAGRHRGELVGASWKTLAEASTVTLLEEAKARLLSGEVDQLRLELTGPVGSTAPREVALHLHAVAGVGGIDHIAAFFLDVSDQRAAEAARDAAMARTHAALLATIDAIGRIIEKRDPYTAGHQHRVSELARAIGIELHLDESRIEGLRLAAMMQDVGKVTCPAEILVKPGRLSAPELAIARMHPEEGAKILEGLELPWPVAEIIHQHHEHVDGTGYPRGLMGDALLLEARIIRVSSAFVALTSHRPYRPAISKTAALSQLEAHRGTRYDEAVVDACQVVVRAGSAGPEERVEHGRGG